MYLLYPLYLLAIVSFLIMWPSASATWFSRCFRLPLSQGFMIALSPIIAGIIIESLMVDDPDPERRWGKLHTDSSLFVQSAFVLAMSTLVVYGVYMQFNGNCNLGHK
jgi:hypothetical protein